MVFDVNTEYFERHGGYEYAKSPAPEAYELAKQIAGGEQYVISAGDARGREELEASDRWEKMCSITICMLFISPVVEKEIRWSKRCRDPATWDRS